MYSGFSKADGSIVGVVGSTSYAIDMGDASDATSAMESLIGVDESTSTSVALIAGLSPATGEVIWAPSMNVDDIYTKTSSMSQMTSMLRDQFRDDVYEKAIRRLIQNFHDKTKRRPSILDIGTGTGLLACFCAKHGAERVLGCEMFEKMADIASEIVKENHFDEVITIINAKSTDIEFDEQTYDILVSELLDSALLGESVLPSHSDAIQRLITCDGVDIEDRVIPHSAQVFATLVECTDIEIMRDTSNIPLSHEWTPFRDESANCRGGWSPVPLHWNEITSSKQVLSKPTPISYIEFSRVVSEEFVCTDTIRVTATTSGVIHGVMTHWELRLLSPSLDPPGSLKYSTSYLPSNQGWQDHWVQVIYPLPENIPVEAGDVVELVVSHDHIKIWISASKLDHIEHINKSPRMEHEPEICACGWHILCGPERIQQLNDRVQQSAWSLTLDRLLNHLLHSTALSSGVLPLILDASDGSTLALSLASRLKNQRSYQSKVVSREQKQFSRMFHSQLASANDLDDNLFIWDGDHWTDILDAFSNEKEAEVVTIVSVISECFYYQLRSMPVAQALSHYFYLDSIRDMLSPSAFIAPSAAFVMVAAVEFVDLSGSHGPVGTVSDIDHSAYDRVIREDWYRHLYPFKIANYRKVWLSEPQEAMSLDYVNGSLGLSEKVTLKVLRAGRWDALVFWVNYQLAEGIWLNENRAGDFPLHYQVSVQFLSSPVVVKEGDEFLVGLQVREGSTGLSIETIEKK